MASVAFLGLVALVGFTVLGFAREAIRDILDLGFFVAAYGNSHAQLNMYLKVGAHRGLRLLGDPGR